MTEVVDPPGVLSDHSLVRWSILLLHQPPITAVRQVRCWRKLDKEKFRSALLQTSLCDKTCQPESADDLFALYDDVLRTLSDTYAPVLRVTTRRQRIAAWMDSECRQLRRNSRRLEQKYRHTDSKTDRLARVEHERLRCAIRYVVRKNALSGKCS